MQNTIMKQNTKTNTDVCCGLTLQCPHQLIFEASGAILWWNFRNKNDRSRLLGANPWRVIPAPGHGLCLPGLYHVVSCPHLLLWWKTESPRLKPCYHFLPSRGAETSLKLWAKRNLSPTGVSVRYFGHAESRNTSQNTGLLHPNC